MIGIDYKIDTLKDKFQTNLFTDVSGNTYTSYGRAFINKKVQDESVPQVLVSGNEYKTVKFNDGLDGVSFMVVENPVTNVAGFDFTGKVSIYFAVNLSKLYPSVTERAVEYLHRDVIELLTDSEFTVTGYVQGLEAFDKFTNVKPTDDMQPYYLVKFESEVDFEINENYNC